MLEVRDLKLQYSSARGVVKAVDGVSFDIEKGEALGIVGESGSGKTSLSLALMRVLPKNVHAYEGQVTLDGKEIAKQQHKCNDYGSFSKEPRTRLTLSSK